MFAEKLDFLMKLTGTQNSVLGRAAHVDASTVSRLRSGIRELPKRQSFLEPMCDFFARNIVTPYQQKAASEAISTGLEWPGNRSAASSLLYRWLTEDAAGSDATVRRLITSISSFRFQPQSHAEELPAERPVAGFSYGNEGKRAAVTAFLKAVIASPKPRTLLLYSDEAMNWLYEDRAFARLWATLLFRALDAGNRIRIIHTVSRTLDEMLEALDKWIPVYMTGGIEPYYCPKLRDGITRRTLFIAQGLAAVTSSSVGAATQEALNHYIDDPVAVKALESEFQKYFELCLPLMRVIQPGDAQLARDLLGELIDADGDSVVVHRSLSLSTMPPDVARSIGARQKSDALVALRDRAASAFAKNVSRYAVYEILTLPDANEYERFPVPVSALCLDGAFYTREEYAAHLRAMIELLEKHENYHVLLPKTPFMEENIALYCKERTGEILARTNDPTIAFAINEPNLTSAFGAHLMRQITGMSNPNSRKDAIDKLERLCAKLSD